MKTAVEWIAKELYEKFEFQISDGVLYNEIIEQAKEMEDKQMQAFGKMVADKWGMMPVPMSNIEQSYNEGKVTWWGGNPGMNNDVKTTNKKISDLPLTMSMNDVFGGKDSCIVDAKSLGETTITFPKPEPCSKHECLPYNPNRASLENMSFKFYQEENCVDGGEGEELIVEAKSSLGIDGDGGAFYVLRTEQWAFSDINELVTMLKRVERAIEATNPTSIHVK